MDTFTDVPPLTWTGKPKYETGLKQRLEDWMRTHPEATTDNKMVVVIRTITQRILGNLDNSNLHAYDPQEVSYKTVWATLRRDQHILDAEAEHEWAEALHNAWIVFEIVLTVDFTEPDETPDDS